jgi:hypothetical protein
MPLPTLPSASQLSTPLRGGRKFALSCECFRLPTDDLAKLGERPLFGKRLSAKILWISGFINVSAMWM